MPVPLLQLLGILLVLTSASGCCMARQTVSDSVPVPTELAGALAAAAPGSSQLLVVLPVRPGSSRAFLFAFDRKDGAWTPFAGPLKAMVGRNGFARPGGKREGDGHNPVGLFPLESAFGYDAAANTRMPYRQATADDLWVDDDKSPEYNQWVKRGQTTATSFEEMKLPDDRYRHGLVTGYNRSPVVAGLGSAIFVHVWLEEGKTTAGCVALEEKDLVALLAWLDPARKPAILMGDPGYLATLPGLTALAVAYHPLPPTTNEQMVLQKAAGTDNRLVEYATPEGFAGVASAIPPRVEAEMRRAGSWRQGCPVPITDLAYLVLTYWGFDDKPHVGELVVHKKLALPVVKAFADLYGSRLPIEKMELIEHYDADDDRSMEANNTSAFNCRDVTGKPGMFSKHSYGGAIDINPVQNPYITPKGDPLKALGWDGAEDKGAFLRRNGFGGDSPAFTFCSARPADCLVLPPSAVRYADRSINAPGMLLPGSTAVKAFTGRGFDWGGAWQRLLDYQHFEYDVK